MIIDFHTHVLPPAIKQDRRPYVAGDKAFAQIYSSQKARIATADDLLENMDREGIDFSVIVNYGWSTRELCRETNDYILESVARFPRRLAGFCAVADIWSDESLGEIERCRRDGARGIGELRPDLALAGLVETGRIEDFSRLLRESGLPLLLHASEPVGHHYPGKGAATPGLIYDLLQGLQEIPVICAHWGGGLPFYTLMPEVRATLENVYFDTAASPYLYRPEIYSAVSRLVGADRILFGSDFPVISPGRILGEIEAAGLPPEDKELIISENARRLLRI